MNSPLMQCPPPETARPPSEEIDGANVRVYYLSRNWSVLALLLAGFLAVGVFLARLLSDPTASAAPRDAALVLQDVLRERKPELQVAASCLHQLPTVPLNFEQDLAQSYFTPGAKSVLAALAESLRNGRNEPNAPLLILAHRFPAEPGANEIVSDLFARKGEPTRARHYLQRELESSPALGTRGKWVRMLTDLGEMSALAELARDPSYAPVFPSFLKLRLAFFQKDWAGAADRFLEMQIATFRLQPLVMTLAAGLAWLAIALHAGQPHHWFSFRMLAPLVATVFGVMGGFAAQWLTIGQGEVAGIRASGDFVRDLGFYAGIIGPRDAALKLLLSVPFLPWLVRRRSALDTLVVMGCVGLGFAIPGNLETCKQLAPADSLGHLLTANFFHFAAAALIGLAICRCLMRERGSLAAAAVTIPSVVLTHGVYDAFTRIPGAHVLMVMATIAFLIVSRVFFIELRNWRDSFTDQCFLGATLIVSLGALVAIVLVAAATESGFENASAALIRNLPTLLMVGVVFFGQFKRGFAPIGSDLTVPSHA